MVFSYYNKLSAAAKRVYRQSDSIHAVPPLPRGAELQPLIPRMAHALLEEDKTAVEELCRELANGITMHLNAPPLRVKVLAVRPSASWGELHGLYEPAEARASAPSSLSGCGPRSRSAW